MREYDLEQCPWCHGEAMMSDDGKKTTSHIVRCTKCSFCAGTYEDDGKKAAQKWNEFCCDVARGQKAWWAIHMADDFFGLVRALLGIIPFSAQRKWPTIISRAQEFLQYEQNISPKGAGIAMGIVAENR